MIDSARLAQAAETGSLPSTAWSRAAARCGSSLG